MNEKNIKKGGILTPSISIRIAYEKSITRLIAKLAKAIKTELEEAYAVGMDAMDASVTSQARIRLNALLDRFMPQFNQLAKDATDLMIQRTHKNVNATFRMSLKEISKDFVIGEEAIDDRTREILKASTEEAANLIRLIPQKYLADVQGYVMRSIVGGQKEERLSDYLTRMYNGNVRHAKLVALDQTRKAYNGLAAAKMQNAGMTEFEWIHSGGGQHPRQLHQQMNGKIYDLNDPPFIGRMYGQDVYGKPGDLPNCRCKIRLIVRFGKKIDS